MKYLTTDDIYDPTSYNGPTYAINYVSGKAIRIDAKPHPVRMDELF